MSSLSGTHHDEAEAAAEPAAIADGRLGPVVPAEPAVRQPRPYGEMIRRAPPRRLAERREGAGVVLAASGRLDAEYRAVLVRRDIEGFDYQQMADGLGLPLGTLKSRLFRARLALRDELKPYLKEK